MADDDPSRSIHDALARMGLVAAGERPALTSLAGGISSEIYRVDLRRGPVCVKRALPRLRVQADWFAPVERNAFEAAWFRRVAEIAPEAVPRLIGDDRAAGLFVMEYLPPERYPVWKARLRDGHIEPDDAARLGGLVVRLHAATHGRSDLAERFAGTGALFHALRLEPFLLWMRAKHPSCASALTALAERTAATRRVLVHGDCSPKNVLMGPDGPVLLDAETCTWGDPAFDPAFCLNHLLLKCLWRPQWRTRYLDCVDALWQAYAAGVAWEPATDLEARVAALLPALLLARVDGKSPAEYLHREAQREWVRRVAVPLIEHPVRTLAEVVEIYREELKP